MWRGEGDRHRVGVRFTVGQLANPSVTVRFGYGKIWSTLEIAREIRKTETLIL